MGIKNFFIYFYIFLYSIYLFSDNNYNIDLPLIGEITLSKNGSKYSSKIVNKDLPIVPVVIDDLDVTLDKGNLSFNGESTILGKKSSVQLDTKSTKLPSLNKQKKVNKISNLSLLVNFKDPIVINILPNKNITIKNANLNINSKKDVYLSSNVKLFKKDVAININWQNKIMNIKFYVDSISLADIINSLKDEPIANIKFNNVNFLANTSFNKNSFKDNIDLEFNGKADFSNINISGIKANGLLDFDASFNKKKGLNINIKSQSINIPKLGACDGYFNLSYLNKNLIFSLKGAGYLNLPEIGKVAYSLSANYKNKEFFIQGDINQEINYKGLQLKHSHFKLNTKPLELNLYGDAVLFDIDLNANLKVLDKSIDFNASLKSNDFKPFANSNIDVLKNIVIKNGKVGFKADKKGSDLQSALYIKGESIILNTDLLVTLEVLKSASKTGLVFKGKIKDEKWLLSNALNTIPEGLKDIVDIIKIKNGEIIASTMPYNDLKTKQTFNPGISILGSISLSEGFFKAVGSLTQNQPETEIDIWGTLSPKISDINFGLRVNPSSSYKSDNIFEIGPLSVDIKLLPMLFKAQASVFIKPNDNSKPIEFFGDIIFTTTDVAGELAMKGAWNNFLGLKDLSVADLALKLGINYELLTAPEPVKFPTLVGFAGALKLDNVEAAIVAQADATLKDIGFRLMLNKLTLKEIVDIFAKRLNLNINYHDIPYLAIQGVDIKYAAKPITVGALTIDPGITLRGIVDILDSRALVDFEISSSGFKALGCMSEINIPGLKISKSVHETKQISKKYRNKACKCPYYVPMGIQKDLNKIFVPNSKINAKSRDIINKAVNSIDNISKSGEKFLYKSELSLKDKEAICKSLSNGPILDIEINTNKQLVFVSGDINLADIFKADGLLIISLDKFLLDLDMDILDKAASAHIKAKSKGQIASGDFDFDVYACFDQRFAQMIINAINQARKDIINLEYQLSQKIAAIKKNEAKKEFQDLYAIKLGININDPNFVKLQNNKSSLENDVKKMDENLILTYNRYNQTKNAVEKQKIAQEYNKLMRQKNQKEEELKRLNLNIMEYIYHHRNNTIFGSIARNTKANLSNIGYQTQKTLLTTTSQAAKNVLNSTQESLGIVSQVVKNISNSINIEKVEFEGSLKNIKNGVMPDLKVNLKILGNPKCLKFNFDFKNFDNSLDQLAHAIIDLLTPDSSSNCKIELNPLCKK